MATVVENKTKKLVFKIPELPSGTYQMEVRTRLANSSELRTGRFGDPLTAEGAAQEQELEVSMVK